MPKYNISIAFICLWGLLLFSCAKTDQNSKVYAITRLNSPDTSYLIGSIHYIPENLFNARDAEKFQRYFDHSEFFVMEADIDSSMQFFERFKMEFKIKNCKEILENQELVFITSFLKDSLNFSDEEIENFLNSDPITAGNTLESRYVGKKYFYFDQYLRAYAKHKMLKIRYLDSPDRYYNYMCKYFLLSSQQIYFRNDSLKTLYFNELNTLFNGFVRDIPIDETSYSLLSMNDLIKQRNSEWMKKIPSILEEGNCIIVVGKGHVPDLLSKLSETEFQISALSIN